MIRAYWFNHLKYGLTLGAYRKKILRLSFVLHWADMPSKSIQIILLGVCVCMWNCNNYVMKIVFAEVETGS